METRPEEARPEAARPEEAHRTSLVVWDVPPTVECGEGFRARIGLKCSAGCRPEGWAVAVRDGDGRLQAQTAIEGEPWPGTTGLFHADVHLTASDREGLHAWEASATMVAPVGDEEHRHDGCVAPFRVRVVPAPEFHLAVVAVDAETGSPVEGAKVFAHPYETFTDERGAAELRLPAGAYRLFVSGRDRAPFRVEGDLTEDATIRAELSVDRELSDADIWF